MVVHFFYDILLLRLCVEWWLPPSPPDMQMQLAGRNLCKLASSPAVCPCCLCAKASEREASRTSIWVPRARPNTPQTQIRRITGDLETHICKTGSKRALLSNRKFYIKGVVSSKGNANENEWAQKVRSLVLWCFQETRTPFDMKTYKPTIAHICIYIHIYKQPMMKYMQYILCIQDM